MFTGNTLVQSGLPAQVVFSNPLRLSGVYVLLNSQQESSDPGQYNTPPHKFSLREINRHQNQTMVILVIII